MIFTFYYMYATILQWWRLASLKNKLNGTLNTKNALLLSNSKSISTGKRQRSIENLLFYVDDRIACTIVPKQNVNMSHWVFFPRDPRTFPIHIKFEKYTLKPPFIHIMVRTLLENYTQHESEVIQIEKFGQLLAWKATNKFELILKTDLENLTKLVHCYWNSAIDINHDLQLLEIETVNIEGNPNRIKYDRKYSLGETLKYSHSPIHWKKFVGEVKELYLRIRENSNPKIKIENGGAKVEEVKKPPIYEVKPIKKESKRQADDKNTLEVSGSDHRRHKTAEKRDKSVEDKHKDKKTKEESYKLKEQKTEPSKSKVKTISPKSESNKSSEKPLENQENKMERLESTEELSANKVRSYLESSKSTSTDRDKSSKSSKLKETKRSRSKEGEIDAEQKTKPREDKEKNRPSTSKADDVKSTETKRKSGMLSRNNDTKDKKSKSKDRDSREKDVKQNGSVVTGSVESENNSPKSKESNPPKLSNDGRRKSLNSKPPNILVYADSITAKENVKTVLNSVINRERYIVYDLPMNIPTNPAWCDSTVLVVICGATTPELTYHILNYLVNGGQLLCLCSDLLHSILSVFSTAEVREHELVRFSYGEWKRVKMMHHIFCYQASPAKKQFSKDSVESNHSNGSSPIAPRTPSTAEIQHNGKNFVLQVQVLGTEETWQTPSLLLANVKNSKGRAVFSQVHLEIDPLQYEEDENKFSALKDSNNARLEILTDILQNRLDIDCTPLSEEVTYTTGYFLGRHEMKMQIFRECKEIVNNVLDLGKITLVFCNAKDDPGEATATRLPIMILSCPNAFCPVKYFTTLSTENIGRVVIYSDVMRSTQLLLGTPLRHGLAVIARRQTASLGRSGNTWLSPPGSACFSLQLHIPLSSTLGRMLSIVQQLVSVAVVTAIRKFYCGEKIDIGIKWPNDIYLDKRIKIGGLIVNSSVGNKMAVLNVGCGLNLDNSEPTASLNEYIEEYNNTNGTVLKKLVYEKYFAEVFNELEAIYEIIQNDNIELFYRLYYENWIHDNAKIGIQNEQGQIQRAEIIGIDDFGFLKVKLENGDVTVVHPDGNSFDMLKGLIVPKSSYKK